MKETWIRVEEMNFNKFCEILQAEVLEFKSGEEWDSDAWNDAYIDFKEGIKSYRKEYINSISSGQLAVKWAREFYCDASWETHSYRVKNKI